MTRGADPEIPDPNRSPNQRSPHSAYYQMLTSVFRLRDFGGVETGGAGRDRTGDLLNANQALSQLSYSPSCSHAVAAPVILVGLGRFELPTSPLSGVRSNHLSYRPVRRKQNYNRGRLDAAAGDQRRRARRVRTFRVEIPETDLEWNGYHLLEWALRPRFSDSTHVLS